MAEIGKDFQDPGVDEITPQTNNPAVSPEAKQAAAGLREEIRYLDTPHAQSAQPNVSDRWASGGWNHRGSHPSDSWTFGARNRRR